MGAHRHTGAGIGDARDVEPVDLRVARLAATQHGVVTRGQLLDAGLGRHAIAHRLERGRLHVIHRGVYAVGHEPLSPRCLQLAAVLACGSGGALSHRSAAELWALLPERHDEALHVSVPSQRRAPAGVTLHRTASPEVTRRHGIPVTTPARTILDLAATAHRGELERALEEARLLRLVSTHDLVRRAHDRPGAARLRRLLGYELSLTRSEAERRLVSLLATAQLPSPRTNVRVAGHEVDAVWPRQRLVVEVDGFTFHASRDAFERDRARDAELQAHGYRVIRVTWRQLSARPEVLTARLGAALLAPG
jgi:very-short-patch-repair endonuclease